MTEEVEVTVSKLLTDLQLTKDNFTQSIPLSDEAYEKQCDSYKNSEEDE